MADPQAQALPDVDALFPAGNAPDVDTLFPPEVEAQRTRATARENLGASPVQDLIFGDTSVNPAARILDGFGQGAKQAWGTAPLGLSPETEKTLRDAGIFNDYSNGQRNILKAANEALMRQAAVLFDLNQRPFAAALGGVVGAVSGASPAAGDVLERGIQTALDPGLQMSLEGVGPVGNVGAAGLRLAQPALRLIARARGLRVIGEDEAAWKGTAPPAPAHPDAALAAAREAQEQQAATPGAPEPPTAAAAAEAAAPVPTPAAPDVHSVARQLDLPLFTEYDALTARRNTFRAWLSELDRQPEGEGAALRTELHKSLGEIDARLNVLAPNVAEIYRAAAKETANAGANAAASAEAGAAAPAAQTGAPQAQAAGAVPAGGAASARLPGAPPAQGTIDASHDVVSGANSSKDPSGPVYIDRRIPQFSPTLKDRAGNPADLHQFLAVHERVEAENMAQGYDRAHVIATAAERSAVEAAGVDWDAYTHEIDGYLAHIEKEKPVNPPPDTHVDPQAAIGHHASSNKQPATPPIDIAGDVAQKLIAAGRPKEEADAAAQIIASHYAARAARFNGARGTASDLYRDEAPDIRGEATRYRDAAARRGLQTRAPGGVFRSGPSGAAAKPADQRSLFEELASRGGIKPTDDLKAIFGAKNPLVPGFGPLLRKTGLTIDEAIEAAKESGHLFDTGDVTGGEAKLSHVDLLDLIDKESRGDKQYRIGAEPKAPQVDMAQQEHEMAQALDQALAEMGIDPQGVSEPVRERAVALMRDEHLDPLEAHERAVMDEARGLELAQSPVTVPTFYSAVGKAVDNLKVTKAPAGQWISTIRNIPGVKPEELEWLGLEDWLHQQKGAVTKEQVQDYIRANQIEVTEVAKGKSGLSATEQAELNDLRRRAQSGDTTLAARDWDRVGTLEHKEAYGETKFGSYTLPGGENYRELLLTLPERVRPGARVLTREETAQLRPDMQGRLQSPFYAVDDSGRLGGFATEEEARANLPKDGVNYKSSHWDEPNILSHIRFNDRLIDGKKTLFIEEVQSDWHQAGKRKGYSSDAIDQQLAVLNREYDEQGTVINGLEKPTADLSEKELGDLDQAIARRYEIIDQMNALHDRKRDGVPNAPFKTTWPELALKRMLRYAAEHGYEKLAWTPGDVQAERYDLSKQVESIATAREPDGRYRVEIYRHADDRDPQIVEKTGPELADFVGKDLADKVIAHHEPDEERYFGHKVWSGLDLKVGGEGMKGFYDKILPAAVSKLTKKFGGKVGRSQMKVLDQTDRDVPFTVRDRDGVVVETDIQSETYAIDRAREIGGSYGFDETAGETKTVPVHTVEITDQLRDAAIEQGFPLFQGRRGKIRLRADGSSTITLMKDADASTFLHETGHQWLEELMRDAEHEGAPADLKADAKTVMDWLGVDKPDAIKTRHHETFARGFETYVMEGRAPTQALADVFAKFRDWLIRIYQTVQRLRSPISAEVRAVFDRLVAAKPEATVIMPERVSAAGFADLHESDSLATPPEAARDVAHSVRDERDSIAAEHLVEDNDARLADTTSGAQRHAPGSAQSASAGDATGAVGGEARVDPQSGALGAGGGAAAGQGAGAPARAGGDLPVTPTQTFPERAETRLIDKAGNIRLDNLGTPEDVSAVIREASRHNEGFIDARRGVISDAQVLDLADALGMDAGQLSTRKLGQAFNAEEIMAARQLLIRSATDVRELMAKAAEGDEHDVLAYAQAKARHLMIQEQVAGLTAEAGRALRAFRNLAGAKEAQALGEFLKDATGKTLFQLQEEAKLGAALPTAQQVSKFVLDSQKPTFGDMVLEYWINGLISGPATHTTYSVGNALLALWKAGPETAAAAGIGLARQALGFDGARVLSGEVPAQLYGMLKGVRDGVVAAWEAAKTGQTGSLPGELEGLTAQQLARSPLVNPKAAIPGQLGFVVRLPSRGVAVIHSFFRTMNYAREMAALSYRQAAQEGLVGDAFAARAGEIASNPTPELMQQARASATDLTLMGHGGELTQALSKLTNAKFMGFQWLKFVDPFVHISSNVIEQAILQRTPLGVLAPEIRANLTGANGPVARDMAIARMAAGSALGVAVGSLAAEGLINGSGPSDPKEARLYTMVNGPPHSVRVGDTWYDVHRLGPLGMLIGISADLYEVAHVIGNEDAAHVAHAISHAFTQNILDESFMRGPADLIKALTDPDRYGAGYVRNFLASFTPFSVGMSQVARAIDPYSRSARSILDAVKQKIPWASQTLLPRRDIFGEPIPNKDVLGVAGLSAIYETKVNNDPVARALLQARIFPSMPTRRIRGVELSDQQYDDYARIAGRMTRMRLNAIVGIPGFAQMPLNSRVELMSQAIRTSRETARTVVMMQNPQIVQQATDAKVHKLHGAPATVH